MQKLQGAVAIFCIACICSELLSQLVQSGWPRRCIKALAGLYILVVILRLAPGAARVTSDIVLPQVSPVEMQASSDFVLQQAETRLEQTLAAECAALFDVPVRLSVTLTQGRNGAAQAQQAAVYLPADCPAQTRQKIADYLRQQLGIEPELRDEEAGG